MVEARTTGVRTRDDHLSVEPNPLNVCEIFHVVCSKKCVMTRLTL